MRNVPALRTGFGWASFVLILLGIVGVPFGLGMEPPIAGWSFLICDSIALLIGALLATGWGVITVLIEIEKNLRT